MALTVAIAIPTTAAPDWSQRAGTIAHACAQPDGTYVYLDTVTVDKIKARQDPAYFVIREALNSNSRIVVSMFPPAVLRLGQAIDVDGVLGTLPSGNRTILNARAIGYFNAAGDLLLHPPIMKGLAAPTPWQWKAELASSGTGSLAAAPRKTSLFPPLGEPSPAPPSPPIFYNTLADMIAACQGGAHDGEAVTLECKSIISSGIDANGSYIVIGEDAAPQTVKVYYTKPVPAGRRINNLLGQVFSVGGEVVVDIDAGPSYDPQALWGRIQTVTPGTIAYAKSLLDGAQVSISGLVVSAGRSDFVDVMYVQDAYRISGIRVFYTGAAVPTRGSTINVTGVMGTTAGGEREIVAGSTGVTVTIASGPVPATVATNLLRLGGSPVNSRNKGITHPKIFNPAIGYIDPPGRSTLGLFVTTFGKVTSVDINSGVMYIDDGSNLANGSGIPNGVKVTWTAEGGTYAVPSVGGFVSGVTGISGIESLGSGQYVRVLRIRNIARPTLTADASETDVVLSWSTQDNTAYRLYRRVGVEGPFNLIATLQTGSYTDMSVTSGGSYTYRVNSVVGGIEGGPSDPVSVAVGPPSPPPDFNPPITTISLSGAQTNGWFTEDVGVTITAMDDRSGVLLTEYDFGDEQWIVYTQAFTVAQEGTVTVRARSIDNSNNEENPPVQEEIKIDKTGPTTTIAVSGSEQNGWYKGIVEISLSASDNAGGSGLQKIEYDFADENWREYTAPFTLDQEGLVVIRARALDNADNMGETVGRIVNIDNLPPLVNLQLFGGTQNGWYNTAVDVIADAIDNAGGSGVMSVEYDFGDGIWMPYLGPIVISQEGVIAVRVRAMDFALNVSMPVAEEIRIDNVSPISVIGLTGNLQNGWYAGDALVTLTAEDNLGGSGIQAIEYDLNDNNWQLYFGPFTVGVEGTTIVRSRCVDLAGNIELEPQQEDVKVDKTSPTVDISLTGGERNGWYYTDVVVAIDALDNDGSGLQTVEYDFSDENWQSYTGPFTVSTEGISVVRARCKDNANNESSTILQEIKLDKPAPTVGIIIDGTSQNGWYNADVTATITASDAGSGVQSVSYDLNDANWLTYTDPFTLSQNGSTIIRAMATDNAGNQSDPVTQLVKIDKIAPTTNISAKGKSYRGTYITDVTITLTGVDNTDGSGIQKIEYDFNDGVWRPYTAPFVVSVNGTTTARARSTDNAGNVGAIAEKIVVVNKDAPVSTLCSFFNKHEIAAGRTIWFNSVVKMKKAPGDTTTDTYYFVNQVIEFSAGGVSYKLPVPDAVVIHDPLATVATTSYDAANDEWVTRVPMNHSLKAFMSGLAFTVPTTLSGGIKPVCWSGQFYTDRTDPNNMKKLEWKWTAAVYSQFSSDYNALGIKAVGGDDYSSYDNKDHTGVPENFKQFIVIGARGDNDKTKYAGQYSPTGLQYPIRLQ